MNTVHLPPLCVVVTTKQRQRSYSHLGVRQPPRCCRPRTKIDLDRGSETLRSPLICGVELRRLANGLEIINRPRSGLPAEFWMLDTHPPNMRQFEVNTLEKHEQHFNEDLLIQSFWKQHVIMA